MITSSISQFTPYFLVLCLSLQSAFAFPQAFFHRSFPELNFSSPIPTSPARPKVSSFAWLAEISTSFAAMEASQTERATPLLTIVACSYEGLAFGWDAFREAEDEQQQLALRMAFGFNLAGGPAKCCAISQSGEWLHVHCCSVAFAVHAFAFAVLKSIWRRWRWIVAGRYLVVGATDERIR
jgi:hypothetical protein